MVEIDLSKTDVGYELQMHSGDLTIMIQALELFTYCLEEDLYVNSKLELNSFAKTILAHAKCTKKNLSKIEEKLNIA